MFRVIPFILELSTWFISSNTSKQERTVILHTRALLLHFLLHANLRALSHRPHVSRRSSAYCTTYRSSCDALPTHLASMRTPLLVLALLKSKYRTKLNYPPSLSEGIDIFCHRLLNHKIFTIGAQLYFWVIVYCHQHLSCIAIQPFPVLQNLASATIGYAS